MRKIVKSGDTQYSDRIVYLRENGERAARRPAEAEAPEQEQDQERGDGGVAEARLVSDEIIRRAVEQSNRIINDASQRAQEEYAAIMQRAHEEAEQMKREGFQQGIEEGARAQVSEIRQCIARLEEAVGSLEGRQAGFMTEYEQNLKWLALEIASKVLAKRIERDDADMIDLVKEAVNSVGGEKWITVEISNTMPKLFDALNRSLRSADAGSRVDLRQIPAPPGACLVDTPTGIVDASLYTQLENLREYFTGEDAPRRNEAEA